MLNEPRLPYPLLLAAPNSRDSNLRSDPIVVGAGNARVPIPHQPDAHGRNPEFGIAMKLKPGDKVLLKKMPEELVHLQGVYEIGEIITGEQLTATEIDIRKHAEKEKNG